MSSSPFATKPSGPPIPAVGRIVHYVARGSLDGVYPPACRAAIITEVPDDVESAETIGLAVLNPTGVFFDRTVYRDEYGERRNQAVNAGAQGPFIPETYELCGHLRVGGSWHWPARV